MTFQTMAIAPHRGLGDLIICNALFRHFAESHSVVVVPVKDSYFDSVTYMLRDVSSIVVVPTRENAAALRVVDTFRASGSVLFLGNKGTNYRREQFDQSFYEQAGLPFEVRWSGFRFIRDPAVELKAPEPPYAFLHEDETRGLVFDRSKACFAGLPECVPTPGIADNIFAWVPAILNAAEIHCIDSSFALLVDSLDIAPSVALYLHRYARPAVTIPTYRLHWQYLT